MRIHPIKSTIPLKFKLELHEPRTHEPTSDVLDVFRIFRGLVNKGICIFKRIKSSLIILFSSQLIFYFLQVTLSQEPLLELM
jgi:hypothetical protein